MFIFIVYTFKNLKDANNKINQIYFKGKFKAKNIKT